MEKEIMGDAMYEVDCLVYTADKLAQNFQESYFDKDEETFGEDRNELILFSMQYEEMAVQVRAIREFLFRARLVLDFANGRKSSIVKAHINCEAKLQSWLENQSEIPSTMVKGGASE